MRGLSPALAWLRSWITGRRSPEELETCSPIPLPGPWARGVALAMHSEAEGGTEGTRTGVGDLLSRFKYAGEVALGPLLGEAMAGAVVMDPAYLDVDVVTHIPPTVRRGGPEPACELALVLARALRVRCLPRLMARTRRTALQKDVFRWAEKRQNVAGALRVRRPDLLRDKKVLLVDDVYDSGATLEEGWRALKEAGAREVVVATVTRTRYRRDTEPWSEQPG